MSSEFVLLQTVEFQISLLLASALVAFFLARTFKQPIVIGLIMVGLLFGPSAFNLITYTEFVKNLASIGAIFLLFAVGLQTKFKQVVTTKSFVVAFLGVVLPWLSGYYTGTIFGYDFITSAFIGTALTATSIAITVQVLKEMGKLNTEVANTIIGAAVIDDVLSLLALSLTIQSTTGKLSLASTAAAAAIAAVFLLAGYFLGTRLIARKLEQLNNWEKKHGSEAMTFIAAIAIAFAYSAAAEAVGLSAIVGAFLAGVSLESVKIKSYREGAEYLEMIFATIFFVSLGVLVDLHQSAELTFVLALAAVAIAGKTIAGFAGSKLFKMGNRDSLVVGLGMSPRGEIALIIALLGLTAGVITQEIYSAIVLVSLITTIVTPFFLRTAYA